MRNARNRTRPRSSGCASSNRPKAVNPSAWVFDAMAGYDVNDSISLQLNAQNLTDKFYLASLNNGGTRYMLGAPRTILLSAQFRY